MGARRYEISLRLLVSHRAIELITRREIPYLRVPMYYFVYHIDTIALCSQEEPTSLMNKNKWIDNPQITIMECIGAES